MKHFALAVLVCLLFASPASAQLLGNWGVGVGVGKVKTTADELESKVTVSPIISRRPSKGFGFAFAFNWFSADVTGSVVGETENLGRLATRPILAGVAYTFMNGKFAWAPTIVAGPSYNTLKVDDRWDGTYDVDDSSFSFAVRPGVSATYSLAKHWAIGAFGGYIVNRPEFEISTPSGVIETKFKGDGFVMNTGVVFVF